MPWRVVSCALAAILLAVLLLGCSSHRQDYSHLNPVPSLGDTSGDTRQLETLKRAEGRAADAQADVLREERAVAGFEGTAELFNWAGGILALASVGLLLASFFVGPTVIPRKVAVWSMLASFGMLAASYFLVRYGVVTAWALLLVFAAHAVVTAWPWLEGRFRRALERKGLRSLGSADLAEQVTGLAVAEAANPVAKRRGTYRPLAPQVKIKEPDDE